MQFIKTKKIMIIYSKTTTTTTPPSQRFKKCNNNYYDSASMMLKLTYCEISTNFWHLQPENLNDNLAGKLC
jgi:hypothetical protein